jgi:hypothetical protein
VSSRSTITAFTGCARSWPRYRRHATNAGGGKCRQIVADLDPAKLVSRGLTPLDVVNAVNAQNLALDRTGGGAFDYIAAQRPIESEHRSDVPHRKGDMIEAPNASRLLNGQRVDNNRTTSDRAGPMSLGP